MDKIYFKKPGIYSIVALLIFSYVMWLPDNPPLNASATSVLDGYVKFVKVKRGGGYYATIANKKIMCAVDMFGPHPGCHISAWKESLDGVFCTAKFTRIKQKFFFLENEVLVEMVCGRYFDVYFSRAAIFEARKYYEERLILYFLMPSCVIFLLVTFVGFDKSKGVLK